MLIQHQTTTTVEIDAPSTGEEYNMEPALDPWLVGSSVFNYDEEAN